MYLTYQEYSDLGFNDISEEEYKKLEAYAERHINLITRDYYVKHSLQEDTFSYRVNKFKLAMAIQIDFLRSLGGNITLSDLLNDSPTSVSIGRTRIENNNAGKASTVGRTMLSSEAYNELIFTGLLYKGATYR